MGVLRKALQPITGSGIFWPQDYRDGLTRGRSLSGVSVNGTTAYGLTAFWAAVRAISEDIAKLPFHVYENLPDRAPGRPGGKRRAADHPLYPVLHDKANSVMSAFTWREVSVAHLVSWGNCYSEIVKNGKGEVAELWPLPPDRVQVKRDPETDEKFYRIRLVGGGTQDLDAVDVFHVPGLGYDGLVGYNPIDIMAKAIGVGLAAQEYAERIWDNDGRPGGWLQVPPDVGLTEKGKRTLRREWDSGHKGLTNVQRIAILEDNITFHEANVTPETAQFIESRKFQVREIARAFRMPPHKIGDLDQATFSNIEQQALEYVQDCLMGWANRIEAQVRMQLLEPPFYAELLFDQLLRGDTLTRYQAYAIARNALGTMTPNIIAERENLPLREDAAGDEYLRPLNMALEGGGFNPDGSPSPLKLSMTTTASITDLLDQLKAGLITHDEARAKVGLPPMEWSETPDTDELVKKVTAGLMTLDEARAVMGLPPIEWADGPTPDEMTVLLDQLKAGVLTHDEVRQLLKREPMVWDETPAPEEMVAQVNAGLLTHDEARAIMKRPPIEWAAGPSVDEVNALVAQMKEGLLTADEARAQLGREPIAWPEDLSEKVTQADALIKAGFDPVDVMQHLGLPPIRHLGLPPVTIQKPADAAGVKPVPATEPPADAVL